MSDVTTENEKGAGREASAFERFVMCFAPHIREWAILYVIGCYLMFVVANQLLQLEIYMQDPTELIKRLALETFKSRGLGDATDKV